MQKRLESIDALRGFDMLFIMGLSALLIRLSVALGWGADGWLAQQMRHPAWMGLTFIDTIFPLFIFIAGLSFPFSMAKQLENGRTRAQIAWRVLRRGLMLVLLGMLHAQFFKGEPFRFGSVLGRIGMTWAFAAWLYLAFGARVRAAIAGGILLVYWAVVLFIPAPGHTLAEVFTPAGNISGWIDRTLLLPLGRISPGTAALPFDNQGLLGTLPATVTAMLGMFTGEFVRTTHRTMSGGRQTGILFGVATVLAALGCLIAFGCGRWSFPISKPLWSPSFLLVVGGYSVAMFALFHWLIDVKGWWRRTLFFRVIGLNAITIYIAQPLLGLGRTSDMLFGRLAHLVPDPWGAVVSGVAYIATCWGFLYFLHVRNIHLKV